MTALCWWVFWLSFWSSLYEPPRPADVIVLADYRRHGRVA